MSPAALSDSFLASALGNLPFPWQERLFTNFLDGIIPSCLDLPTGLGKTAIMGIWLAARAEGAGGLPRRLVYVVDRRAVVDQASREAERLRDWCDTPELQRALGLEGRALPISTLRGRFVDNRAWLEDPTAPAIVVGTVDMIGSRLLFEGYGCSRRIRPFQAGFLGADCLFVLDESHLVPPFERLLEAVLSNPALRGRDSAARSFVPRSILLSLSATGRLREGALRLDERDREHAVVRRRIYAPKGLARIDVADGEVVASLVHQASILASEASVATRIVIFTHKREVAEQVHAALPGPPEARCLFVGARRLREREEAERQLTALGFLAGSPRPGSHSFLVATSAAEVGVDLDADHMVMDLVPYERLVQRLGRVNRRGEGRARVRLVVDETTREAHGAVLDLLAHSPATPDGETDVSPAALEGLRAEFPGEVRAASTPEPLHPPLDLPTLEAWTMTSLEVHSGRPEVAPWLRGWVEDTPQTEVLWRRHLPPTSGGAVAARLYLEAAPAHGSELLQTETWRVVDWLRKRVERLAKRGAWPDGEDAPQLYVLDGSGELASTRTASELRGALGRTYSRDRLERALAGRRILLPAAFGGLSPAGLLDANEDGLPPTLDEVGPRDDGGAMWLPCLGGGPAVPMRLQIRTDPEPTLEPGWHERLRLVLPDGTDPDPDAPPTRWLVIEKWREDSATEDDRSAGRPQSLAEHQEWTRSEAERIARRLALPEEFARTLGLAAALHDEGKRARNWQAAFGAPPGEVLAKTRRIVAPRLLGGYRHEFGSLPHAERDARVAALPEEQRELLLHLVASHHGLARPTIPVDGCEDAPPSRLAERAQRVALRFVELQRRLGPWGLAWFEALLRAADQRASRRNDEREDS